MKKITISFISVFLALAGFSQSTVVKLREYKPAPGQHINIENIGTPAAAQKMTKNFSSLVSLGSFGGYIVLEFEEACKNHPDNPYGIDFTIVGNSFTGSSEPGVVWVMQDENQNGLPDDTWYEIAGSLHFCPKTIQNYQVTYFKTGSRDVFWIDNNGKNGWILGNSFNLQEYYPTEQNFSQYPQDSITFCGTLLPSTIDFSNTQEIKVKSPAFGYADSHSRKQGVDLFVPDNPYTKEVEGAGGDPIDISWAIDSLGNYVDLDSIHFVKMVSGSLKNAGWLGEISTDVAWVETVLPNSGISGRENMLVIYSHPSKILAGDSVQLETAYFEKGRRKEAIVTYSSQNEQVLEVNSSGMVKANGLGETVIFVSANDEPETVSLKVVSPDSILILTDFSSVYSGDTLELFAHVFDNEQEKLDIPVQINSSNPAIGTIIQEAGKFYFLALQAGQVELTFSVEGFPTKTSQAVKIHSVEEKIKIYFTLKTEDENLLPFQWIEVGVGDLNGFVEKRQNDYSMLERPALVHALVAGLQKAEVSFVFRDDDTVGGKLYLYSVENKGLFSSGWGGKTKPEAFARAWMARLNHKHFLNDFDKTAVFAGDTVALYHVSKIREPWVCSRMLVSPDSAVAGDEMKVQLSQKECTLSEGKVLESDFVPVPHAEIDVGNTFYTNKWGQAVFLLETEPPLVISSGTDAVFISKKIITKNDLEVHNHFKIYPNPAENDLVIEGFYDGEVLRSVLKLFTPGGQIVFEKEVQSNRHRLNLSSVTPGIYFLTIIQGEKAETHKIIKK